MLVKNKKYKEALANSKKTATLNWASKTIEGEVTTILLEQFVSWITLEEARKAAKQLIAQHEKAQLRDQLKKPCSKNNAAKII